MSRVDDIISGVKTNGTKKKKSRVESIIEDSSNGKLNTGVDEQYINTFLNDADDYFSNVSNDFKNIGYGNASTVYDNYFSKGSELRTRANTIRAYLNSNKNNLNEDAYKSLTSTLDKFDRDTETISTQLRRASEYYSQWKTEDEYNDAVKLSELNNMSTADIQPYLDQNNSKLESLKKQQSELRSKIQKYNRGDRSQLRNLEQKKAAEEQLKKIKRQIEAVGSGPSSIAYTTMGGQNITWQNLYNDKKAEEDFNALYSDLSSNSDWNEVIKNAKEYQNPSKSEAEAKTSFFGIDIGETSKPLNKVTYYEKYATEIAFGEANGGGSTQVHSRMGTMKDGEKDIYNYYFGRGEYDKAEEYLNSLESTLQDRFENKLTENAILMAEERPVLASALSVWANLASGAEYIRDTVNYWGTGELDTNHSAELSNAIRGTVANKVDWEIGNWDAFDFLYNTTMSGVDSATAMLTFGGAGGLALGLSAAAQGTNDALNRGMSNGQAFWNGFFSGVFEGFFESVSIGNFNALKEGATTGFKSFAKNIGKSMLTNASEEALTELANIAYDTFVNGEFANYTLEDLKNGGWKNALGQVFESAASGALMGFGFGAVGGAVSYYNTSSETNAMYGDTETIQALISEGLASAEGSLAHTLAKKYQAKLDAGKSISGGQLAQLIEANEQAFIAEDVSKMTAAAEARLTELGETGDVSKIAKAIVKKASGKLLSISDETALENSKYGQRVVNEISPEGINSGEYTSAWAENIGTERINVDEYNRIVQSAQTEQNAEDSSPVAGELPQINRGSSFGIREGNLPNVEETSAESVFEADNGVETETKAEDNTANRELAISDVSKKYGAQAGAMVATYNIGGGNQDVAKYDKAYQAAYDMGNSGVALSYVMNSESTAYLTEKQKELAYEAGKAASDASAKEQEAKNKNAVNGKKGRKKGAVKGENVTISDLKKSFNDTQNVAYKVLTTYAEATGIDIVLYKSETDADGNFIGSQGKFKWSEDTIYVDINAGLANIKDVNDLAKYAMLRTFSHEFTHFIEKWNPVYYNEFRKAVFDTLTERGENVHDLIEEKMSMTEGMTYEKASREVVAEAMTDILPDSNFVETLATNHKNIFDKLLEKLKEFLADLKAYFNTIGHNRSREANALKEQVEGAVHYVDNIVKLFDKVAAEAVENYQMTVATDEVAENSAKIESTDTINAENNATLEAKTEEYDHFTITDNAEGRVISIKFDGKPIDVVREVLKSNAFVWNKTKGEWFRSGKWYSKNKVEDVVSALQKAYESETENNTDGGITNVGEETTEVVGETGRGTEESLRGTQTEDSNKRGVSEESGRGTEIRENSDTLRERHGGLSRFPNDAYITAQNGTVEYAESAVLSEYGIENHVVKRSAWDKEFIAFARAGKVYMREGLEESHRDSVGYHEATHVMYQQGYEPYIDFVDRTPEMLNMSAERTLAILAIVEKHRKMDAIDTDDTSVQKMYDELNAIMYGHIAKGLTEEQRAKFSEVFNDFDAYEKELSAIHEQFKKENAPTNKEKVKNGENVDNRSTVQQPVSDRQGDSQVLDELQAQDVQGDVQRGDTVGDSVERGQQTVRDDVRPDAERTGRGPSEGDGKSGDIRRDDELTPEAKEKLHEEVTEQIAQQSTELPKGKNFVIGDSLDLPNGEKARYKANIDAIKLVKQLEAEGRYATEAEQVILSKYVGWGGLANAFDERKADWSKEYSELKELLTKEEYELARGSTLNAHYTDISVIKAMYDGLNQLGFEGGRMMEPSSGVGNFVGAMPADMSAKVKSWTMVELDGITGLIAKYLYPNADVRIQGFEKANIPNNYMDVIISNVPFGNYPITDKAYPKKVTSAIHNYFFAKSLDKVRPGGIVMFITSSYTMNSKDETVRRYIMQRADLLGAIRLPDSAFKGNAGTEVVTDILVLKKRAANTEYAGENFLEAPFKYINGYNGAYINGYFDAHPEMVLGTATMDGGMYRGNNLTYKALEGKGSLADQIREAFKSINGKMDYTAKPTPEKTNFAVERAGKKTKADGYVAKDGKIYQNKDGALVEQTVTPKVAERIKGMLEIRDAARDLQNYQQQGLNDTEIKKARQKLNKLYDAFVKKNGFLNSPANKSAFKEDPDCFSLFALENWNNDEKTATKADIFTKNTIAPNRTVTSAKDVSEGLIVSVNQTGGVDTALIAKLTGKTEADVKSELIESRKVFKNRDGVFETAETYLSGNVRAKLRDAEALVPIDKDYQKNVEALKSVMPEDVSYQDIFVNPGTPWIPSSVYSDFAAYMLGGRNTEWRQDIDVTRNPETGNFTVELKSGYLKHNAQNTQKWGTPRRSFIDLFDAMLNSKSVVVKDKLSDGSFEINKDATAAANEKIENITKEFQEWLWKDEARRTELATLYNEIFNSIVTPKYNGDNLTVNGANAMKPLRPHQRNAVQRVISSGGNTLLAHKVGAGKTYEMAAAAMKLKELGLVKKPMFAVPKSLVAQWGTEFIDFFPTAKLLVAEATDFSTANRKVFMNRIANGEYDAVIVSYEQFEKLPVSDDFTRELYQEQINSIIAAIEEAKAEKGAKAMSVKDLEKKRKSLQAKIDKLTDKAKDEGNIDFEELGVDSLFIDEAHNFKNLFYTTSMTNVSGLGNKDGSKRAFDLYTKVRYLQKLNGGKGIVFATATPVMNSMSEMYIMQKYLQPDLLEQLGLNTFDAWAKQFGEVVNGVEIKPSGQGYRVKQSFSRFKNMSELQLLFRNFADVLTDIPGLKIPKMKGGKVNVVVCEPGEFQKNYMKELEKRADNIKNVDPSEDNMLKITSDGRKISYTQRMIDPSLPYEEGCKIYRCADNVVKAYNESADVRGTQLIFCDMATPKGKSKAAESTEAEDTGTDMESAKLYDDIKARLIQGGIPAKEIAFIHEADTDQKKKKLFADVNEGKVRVLIGSTGKMGVGMNAQKRIVAIHHLDAPWRPGDVEQRNGRAYRQGNINEEVECFNYVTEGSFDARLWDILERKQNFINQVMNGESVGRETEDTGEVTLSAAEVKALASGSPLIMEQVQLDTDIKKLESLYRAHSSSVRAAKEKLEQDKGQIANLEKKIANAKVDVANIIDTYSEGKFSITIGKQTFTEKKDAGTALMAEAEAKAVESGYTTIGSFAGFDVRVVKTHEGIKGLISGKQAYSFNTYPGNTTYMVNHLIAQVEGISETLNEWENDLIRTQNDMSEQEKLISEPFAKQSELDEKRKRYAEVMDILNPKEEQSLDSVADDTVQEQSRAYLDSTDSEYMDAVNRGDMETAERMVKEAAQKAGYSETALHGTPHFGFTRLDVSRSDDKMSFFATDSFETASTYSNDGGVRRIGNAAERTSSKKSKKLISDAKSNFNAWVEQLKKDYNIDTSEFNKVFADRLDEEIKAVNQTKTATDALFEISYVLADHLNAVKTELYNQYLSDPNNKKMSLKKFEKSEHWESFLENDFAEYDKKMSTMLDEIFSDNEGVYDLYANTEGHLVIDCKGRNWNNIKSDVLPWKGITNKWTTREVCEYAKNKGYTGVTFKNLRDSGYDVNVKPATVYAFFNPQEQLKSADPVTYDDNGNVIPLSERFNPKNNDIRNQQRTDTLTDREVLSIAASEVLTDDGLTTAEKDALDIFQKRLSNLEALQSKRAEEGQLYKEQQFGTKVDRAKASETLNRMHTLDSQIEKASAELLSVEDKAILKRVLQKARTVVEQKEREHGQEILKRWRDRRNNADAIKKYRDRLRSDVDELTNWILHPNNKDVVKHVPDVLKNSVIPFISSINFMSKRSLSGGSATISDKEFVKRLEALQSAIKTNIDVHGLYSGYNDLPADFMDSLQHFVSTANVLIEKSSGEFIINQMTSEELKSLSKIVRTLKKYIMQINRFHNNAMYSHVYEAGENSIEHLKELGNAGNTGTISNFLLWQQIRPAYAFERFGDGGVAIYDGLRRGQAKLAFNAKEIQKFTEKTYTEKEVKAWENEIKTFSLGKDLVKMPVSYIMGFYELSKDPEALEHINGEGIRVATYTHKGKKISDVGHVLTVGEFNQIINSLTDRQKEVADSLQKYMATQGAKWGNYVSVARFGEELFTNPKYYPINSDGRHLSANAEEHPSAAALYALLNMSFTKSRKEGANNRIVIYSIFDVFANHMSSMAQYNAMALPILDALKWFNYQQVEVDDDGNKHIGDSVRERMDRAYGVPEETRPGKGKSGYAQDFVMNIIKAFNGTEAQGTPYDSLGLKSLHRYNIAQVAYNLRVVVQQPLAITRAGMLIDYSSILKGMKLKPSAIKNNIEEMQKYSGIAAWKSLGFYDVNISRGLTSVIKHDNSLMDKISDVGMWGAEKADLLTWAAIWSACKEEVKKKQHLTPESDGFFDAVTNVFEDVIYKTQVVDSVLTKNEFMRDKGTFARLTGSFMSEPTTNASMLIDAYDKYQLDVQRGMSKRDAWRKNGKMIGRRLYVYGVGAALLAAVQAVADGLRDDDDYEEWYEKWLEAFGGNFVDELLPFNKLPIMSDFYDLAKELASILGVDTYGNPPQSVYMQWYDSLIKGTEIIYDKISGEDTDYTWYGGIYKLLQSISGMSGVPMAAATREAITAWNNIIGVMAPSLKVKTYDSGPMNEIKYAYQDGYLSDEEATALLLEKNLVDTENEAYFIIQGWEAGEGYSKYDKIYDAVLNGGDISAAMDELTSHGYSEEDVISQVKGQIGKWYYDSESKVRITKQQAIDKLNKYTDMTDDEITSTVNRWSSVVVTGIKYEDIDDEFMDGNITASRAIEMFSRYGSMTKEKATEKVTVLQFVKDNPSCEGISYSAVEGYKTYCEPSGVPAETFYDVWKYNSSTSADVDKNGNSISGSKKEKVLKYINSLSLSRKQKDSLYYAFGWAESKLYEAPWH